MPLILVWNLIVTLFSRCCACCSCCTGGAKSTRFLAQHAILLRASLVLLIAQTSLGITCETGWTVYTDDGTEGTDSCIKYVSTITTWSSSMCGSTPTNVHLVTFKTASTAAGLLPALHSLIGNGITAFVGASQITGQANTGVGWSWFDGTVATALNPGN